MDTWSPLWSKIVDSSVWQEPYYIRILFTTMLALKDVDHVVRYTAFQLASRAHMDEQEVLDGWKVLAAPDTRRIEPQPYEGRRIEKVADGWLVLNGEKYRIAVRALWRREYKREHEADRRAKTKTRKVTNVTEKGAQNEDQKARDESRKLDTTDSIGARYVGIGVSGGNEEDHRLWHYRTYADAAVEKSRDERCSRIDYWTGSAWVENVTTEQ